MQGTAGPQRPGLSRAGVIPAHAGKGQSGYRHGQSTRIIPARAGRLAFIIGHHRIRIIPAGAGNGLRAGHPTSGGSSPPTRGKVCPTLAPVANTVHPRQCGETLASRRRQHALARVIPARAGSRPASCMQAIFPWLIPALVRGTALPHVFCIGPSPLVQGKDQGGADSQPCRRFIPANRRERLFGHPAVCRAGGSSPHARGKCAPLMAPCVHPVHPRVCKDPSKGDVSGNVLPAGPRFCFPGRSAPARAHAPRLASQGAQVNLAPKTSSRRTADQLTGEHRGPCRSRAAGRHQRHRQAAAGRCQAAPCHPPAALRTGAAPSYPAAQGRWQSLGSSRSPDCARALSRRRAAGPAARKRGKAPSRARQERRWPVRVPQGPPLAVRRSSSFAAAPGTPAIPGRSPPYGSARQSPFL